MAAVRYGDLNIRDKLRCAVRRSIGLALPCPGLDEVLAGQDCICLSQSSALVAALQYVRSQDCLCQAIVLTASKQRAQQVLKEAQSLARQVGTRCGVLLGGRARRQDLKVSGEGCQIVIGALSGASEMICQGHLSAPALQLLVVEELVQMFAEENQQQLSQICKILPGRARICCVSSGSSLEGVDVSRCLAAIRSFMNVDAPAPALFKQSEQKPDTKVKRKSRPSKETAPPAAPSLPAPAASYGISESFDDLDIPLDLLRGIYSYGFEKPSPIQQVAIKPILDGRDTLFQSQSGTGKTATYAIGILGRINVKKKLPQALVLAPVRELANQIHKIFLALGEFMRVRCHLCIGGTSVRGDIDSLRAGQHVVVGMPGRVFDMLSKRHLVAENLRSLVFDEVDELLSLSYKDQVYDIFKCLPPSVQAVCCSATLPEETLQRCTKFMRNYAKVLVSKSDLMLPGISQFYVAVEKEEWKFDTLCDLYEILCTKQSLVFCNSRRKVDFLADQLHKRDLTVSIHHAELDQKERDLVMREFRSGTSRVLICTGLLARGIDVQMVSVVVHYDLPNKPEDYLHRIGRAGRFGRRGVSICFVTENDVRGVKDLERYYETQMEEMPMDIEDLI